MNRRRSLALFNWCSLLACGIIFAIGGTLAGLACMVMAQHTIPALFALVMAVALYLLAGHAFYLMERHA